MANETDLTDEELDIKKAQMIAEEAEGGSRHVSGSSKWLVPIIAVAWSVFQLLTASVLPTRCYIDQIDSPGICHLSRIPDSSNVQKEQEEQNIEIFVF